MPGVKGLRERLKDGETILCAEGYLFELERRGFAKLGDYTPDAVLDFPERVKALHEEFVLSGSDVVVAYTYYGHRVKMKMIGREDECKTVNLKSLKIAREVADKYHKLMAGNLSNTFVFEPDNKDTLVQVADMFKEQVEWAVEGRADFVIGETFSDFQEARLALDAIKKYGKGMPAVITMAAYAYDRTTDDVPIEVALRLLEDMGADVVGLNCGRGPATMGPLFERVREACKGPLAALPVALRTTEKQNTFMQLKDHVTGELLYPENLSTAVCHRAEIQRFAREASQMGFTYLGLCCGNTPCLFRELAITSGRDPVLARFSPDLATSPLHGTEVKSHKKKIRAFMAGDDGGGVYSG